MLHVARPISLAVLALLIHLPASGEDWPQWRGPNRDGVWRETGIVEKFAGPELEIKWRVPIASGYCGPTIANGRVYAMDRLTAPVSTERVHCFDEQTGAPVWSYSYECPYATVRYPAGPRASVVIDNGRAYALGSTGRLHVFDAATGKLLWETVMAGPGRATPATYEAGGRQFVVIATGSVGGGRGAPAPPANAGGPATGAYVAFALPR